ncbi:RadC family protein [Cellvibrio mixtus]|uniref:RadC family protein n=1 Tax=Cellvibrio mixtus TaxID=39650 RepID=UPI000587541B|nr:DNA repair protein RadC [Cellvibrio mixtus]
MSNDLYLNSTENTETEKLPENISEEDVLYWAEKIVTKRFTRSNYLTSPDATREFLQIILAKEHRELFIVIFLDNQNGVLGYETLFQGTIDGAAIYPREIVKAVLDNNSASVILAHNHPSGTAMPSEADKRITTRVIQALDTIDVRVLDHLVVGGIDIVSFAERGLI